MSRTDLRGQVTLGKETAEGPWAQPVVLNCYKREIKEGELVDSGADGSLKWRKPVGHDMQAK